MISNQVTEQGYVANVRLVTLGSLLDGDHALGVSTLKVEDVADFDEDGGTLVISYLDIDGVTVLPDEYAYLSTDPDTDTITLAAPTVVAHTDSDWVAVSPNQVEKYAVVVVADSDDPVTARIPHNLSPLLNDGVRSYQDSDAPDPESVLVTLVDGEWVLTDILGKDPDLTSVDYAEGESGWQLAGEAVQFPNVAVLDTLGADTITVNALTVGEDDVSASFESRSTGAIAYAPADTTKGNTAGVAGVNEQIMFTFRPGTLYANRTYAISVHGFLTTSAKSGDVYRFRLRYTTNQTSNPLSTSSTTTKSANWYVYPQNSSDPTSFYHRTIYNPGNDYDDWMGAVTLIRATAGGTPGLGVIKNDDDAFRFYILVEDLGLEGEYATSISQISKAVGSSDGTPVQTYTKSWTAQWSQSYDGDGQRRRNDEATTNCYQGEYSAAHGRSKSLVGFNDSDIRTQLTGATIKSVKIKFRVRHSFENNGLDVRIGDHNFSSPPLPYSGTPGTLASKDNAKEGSWYTVTLPNSFGTDLKNGNARGIGFYAPSNANNYYGYMYGAGSGSAPVLTVTYEK